MSPNQKDDPGITDPPKVKPPVNPGENLPNEEADPVIIGPPIKINPTDDNEPRSL